ncbi:MAG: hypothetical protein A2202_04880 [Bdellovibrionales bacterium RIFOXYA1_FULL_36_14]|nr:MAG: hypothetical protein A2202_04880 [Bdellovibrionales bacterium RIFOXYA1_FULL_36_14]
MAKENFNANVWLNYAQNQSPQQMDRQSYNLLSTKNIEVPPQLPDIHDQACPGTDDLLKNFFVSGWRGEDIISKTALNIKKIISELTPDAEAVFLSNSNLNRSLKLLIYNEYLSFTQTHPLPPGAPDNYKDFWCNVEDINSPFAGYLKRFTKIYSFRAVVCYLFRIRFITKLSQAISLELSDTTLINPNSAIQKIFKKGSSTEIDCESLQANQYSWYRPSIEYKDKITQIAQNFHLIGIEEIMKICLEEDIDNQKNEYSPTLSNKHFGLFLNSLLVFFPYWVEGKSYPQNHSLDKLPSVKRCKFTGNDITSLTLSHWLAQEENMSHKWELWSDLICPNFQGEQFSDGNFVRICHELQFLVFLVDLSIKKKVDPRKFISEIIKAKYITQQVTSPKGSQFDMFSDFQVSHEIMYDRIVLNLTDLPKTNSHHSLLGSITQSFSYLRNDGYLFVLTNQKLFVPSQSNKMEQLLDAYKLDANFNFEDLKGKGEIPSYLYILSQKPSHNRDSRFKNDTNYISNISEFLPKVNKYPCTTFRICGELSSINKYNEVVCELENFLLNTSGKEGHPVFYKELSENILFEYFQDAIVDGKLISSTSKEPDNITHPSFFKNLTKACLPLKSLFKIESLQHDSDKELDGNLDPIANELLGVDNRAEDKYPLVLIVDFSKSYDVNLEIVSASSYLAKAEEYGMALYKYFGLTPKSLDINVDLIREFFNSNLGKQLIALSINSQTKIKSKLELLLIPRFFSMPRLIDNQNINKFALLSQDEKTIKSYHPTSLSHSFEQLCMEIDQYKNIFPCHIAGLLISFKHKIHDVLRDFDKSSHLPKANYINYTNPSVIEAILPLPTYPIYPQNKEYFIDFTSESPVMLNAHLTSTQITTTPNASCLEFFSRDKNILKIYSDIDALGFVKFIIDSSLDTPILHVLHNLHVPQISDLKKVILNFKEMETTLSMISAKVESMINKIFTEQISQAPK